MHFFLAILIVISIEVFILSFAFLSSKIEEKTEKYFKKIEELKFNFLFKYEIKKEKSRLGSKIIKIKINENLFFACRFHESVFAEYHSRITLTSNNKKTVNKIKIWYCVYKLKKALKEYEKRKQAIIKRF